MCKMKNRLMVIAFSGPDGTGKTSCAKYLIKSLNNMGIVSEKIWIKHTHTVAYLLVKFQELMTPTRVIRSWSGTYVTNSLASSRLWPWIEFLGLLPKLIRIKIKFLISRRRKFFIADRFLLDSLVHISIAQGKNHVVDSLPFKFIASFLKKYALTFWFDGNEKILIKRKGDKADPMGYIKLQRQLYSEAVKKFNIPVIYINTTQKSLEEVCKEVHDRIFEELTSKGLL